MINNDNKMDVKMICTSIEQSKRLLELGLDPKTADMVWMFNKWLYSIKDNILNREQFSEQDTLAWSLSALLEVMPSSIRVDGIQYYHHLEKNNEFYTVSYYFDDIDELYALYNTKVCESPIGAAYEMVCWLLEDNLITNK